MSSIIKIISFPPSFFLSFFLLFFSLSLFSPRAISLNKYDRRSAIANNERGKCLKGLGLFLFKRFSPRILLPPHLAKENVNPFGGAVHFHHTSRCYCANGIANKIFQIADNTGRYREMVICLISDASNSNIRPPIRVSNR